MENQMTTSTFVTHGAFVTSPPPYMCADVSLFQFFLKADKEELQKLVDKTLNRPSGGEVEYCVLGDRVQLSVGRIGKISSLAKPYDTYGYATENQATVWIFLEAKKRPKNAPSTSRFVMFPAYAIVDNPMSQPNGREVFGYPKCFGWPELSDLDSPDHIQIDVYGMNFGPKKAAGRRKLIELSTGNDSAVDWKFEGVEGFDEQAEPMYSKMGGEHGLLDDLKLSWSIFKDLTKGQMQQVFLRQFRPPGPEKGKVPMEIIEAPVKVTSIKGGSLTAKFDLEISSLDSHPMIEELGLEPKSQVRGARLDMDFRLEHGTTTWSN